MYYKQIISALHFLENAPRTLTCCRNGSVVVGPRGTGCHVWRRHSGSSSHERYRRGISLFDNRSAEIMERNNTALNKACVDRIVFSSLCWKNEEALHLNWTENGRMMLLTNSGSFKEHMNSHGWDNETTQSTVDSSLLHIFSPSHLLSFTFSLFHTWLQHYLHITSHSVHT